MSDSEYDNFKDAVEVLEKFVDTLKPRSNAYYSIALIVARLGRKELDEWDLLRDD